MDPQNPNGQAAPDRDRALDGVGDPRAATDADADWDRLGSTEDPDALYTQEPAGQPTGPTSGAEQSDQRQATTPAPESLDEVDFREMSLEDRVSTVRAFAENPQMDEQKALDIADGYMRKADYTQKTQALANNTRMTQQLLQQAGYNPPDSPGQMSSFLQQQAPMVPQAQGAPQAQQPAQPNQGEVSGPPPGTVEPFDIDGFANWWERNMDTEPTRSDYERWKHEMTFGQMQRQQIQSQVQQQVHQAQGEWEDVQQEFTHAGEPGIEQAVEQRVRERLQRGDAYPGMVREVYLGMFAEDAYKRRMVDQQQPQQGRQQADQPMRQAPPVPPGGPGGDQQSQQQQHDLSTDDGIMEKQMSDDGFLSAVESTFERGETNVYDEAAERLRG